MNKIILIITITLLSFNIYSQNSRAIRTQAPFLLIPTDAKGSAMGETGVAGDADVYSYYWNSAKFAFTKDKINFAVSYTPWLRELGVTDVNLNSVDAFYKIDDLQTIAANLSYFGMGSIQYTDDVGGNISTFSPNEFSLGATYARKFTNNLSFGLNVKFIYSNLAGEIKVGDSQINEGDTKPATAFAADLAGYYITDFELFGKKIKNSYGFNFTNLGSKISYTENKEAEMPIPSNFRIGTSFKFDLDKFSDLRISLEAIKLMVPTPSEDPNDNTNYSVMEGIFMSFTDAPGGFSEEMDEVTPSIGIEYNYAKTFSLRGGYMHENETKGARKYLTLGVGLIYNAFNFDISYYKPTNSVNNALNNQLKFSLSFKFKDSRNSEAANRGRVYF